MSEKNKMVIKKYTNNYRKHHKIPMLRGAAKRRALKHRGITISSGTRENKRFLRKLIALPGSVSCIKLTSSSCDYINIFDIKPEV